VQAFIRCAQLIDGAGQKGKPPLQNRRQKVFNREALRLRGGLHVLAKWA